MRHVVGGCQKRISSTTSKDGDESGVSGYGRGLEKCEANFFWRVEFRTRAVLLESLRERTPLRSGAMSWGLGVGVGAAQSAPLQVTPCRRNLGNGNNATCVEACAARDSSCPRRGLGHLLYKYECAAVCTQGGRVLRNESQLMDVGPPWRRVSPAGRARPDPLHAWCFALFGWFYYPAKACGPACTQYTGMAAIQDLDDLQ